MSAELATPTWKEFFKSQEPLDYFKQLREFIQKERSQYEVYPPSKEVFSAFKETPLDQVKVVIVGQDPYHGPGQAHGLCFSVKKGIAAPPSLKNIFQETGGEQETDLRRWARQGVLLLNTVLTVRRSEAFSHRDRGWELFTDEALRFLQNHASRKKAPIVYLLWGASAGKKVEKALKGLSSCHAQILKAPHPSPLSAYRGFLGCGHFKKTNEILRSYGEKEIVW